MYDTRWKWLALAALSLSLFCGSAAAEIYKVVDENGNVTYTDQAPSPAAQPLDLPKLPVVETTPVEPLPDVNAGEEASDQTMTRRDLRRMYRDFHLTRPAQDETFWGTGNTVVVSWDSSTPLMPDMSVRLLLDGEQERITQTNMVALTLNRGTHTVQAELRDGRGRRVATTEQVTFYVKQYSRLFNQQQSGQNGGP